ncbi:hypothetical protein NC651_014611 [Populus alba x Populus x berolinensis]|nr:hypothetical protein NC651_014611 [Populus alba x Populus x berolinensis]
MGCLRMPMEDTDETEWQLPCQDDRHSCLLRIRDHGSICLNLDKLAINVRHETGNLDSYDLGDLKPQNVIDYQRRNLSVQSFQIMGISKAPTPLGQHVSSLTIIQLEFNHPREHKDSKPRLIGKVTANGTLGNNFPSPKKVLIDKVEIYHTDPEILEDRHFPTPELTSSLAVENYHVAKISTDQPKCTLSKQCKTCMLGFLADTGAPYMVNAYPYFAYRDNPDAQLDAIGSAIVALGSGNRTVKITISESGCHQRVNQFCSSNGGALGFGENMSSGVSGPSVRCVAKPHADEKVLQAVLDLFCGPGGVDCREIYCMIRSGYGTCAKLILLNIRAKSTIGREHERNHRIRMWDGGVDQTGNSKNLKHKASGIEICNATLHVQSANFSETDTCTDVDLKEVQLKRRADGVVFFFYL